MNRKKKTCKLCRKEAYIFSKGRCKACANIEYAAKRQQKLKEKLGDTDTKQRRLERKPLKPTNRHKTAKDAERVAMEAFWNSKADLFGNCHCEECKAEGLSETFTSVGDRFNPYCVAHIISKGANPAFRCDLRNFIILCPDHHNMFDGQVDGKTRNDMKVFDRTESVRAALNKEDLKTDFN